MADTSLKATLAQLETTLDLYLVKKAPALPDNIKEIIVKIAPWLTIVGLVLSIPALLALLGLSAVVMPLAAVTMARGGFDYVAGIVFLVAILALEAFALPGLFGRKKQGWNLIFYSVLLSAVQSLLSFNLFGLIIGTLIGLYVLFQVRSYYH